MSDTKCTCWKYAHLTGGMHMTNCKSGRKKNHDKAISEKLKKALDKINEASA